jgi:hypothetical protein
MPFGYSLRKRGRDCASRPEERTRQLGARLRRRGSVLTGRRFPDASVGLALPAPHPTATRGARETVAPFVRFRPPTAAGSAGLRRWRLRSSGRGPNRGGADRRRPGGADSGVLAAPPEPRASRTAEGRKTEWRPSFSAGASACGRSSAVARAGHKKPENGGRHDRFPRLVARLEGAARAPESAGQAPTHGFRAAKHVANIRTALALGLRPWALGLGP